jgi:excisionase family DNA binding protein
MKASPEQITELMARPTISVEEAAMVLGIGRGPAYKAVNKGEIHTIRINSRLLVPTSWLRELLESSPAA